MSVMAYDYQSNRPGRGQGDNRNNRRGGSQGRDGQRTNEGQNRRGQGHGGDYIRNGQGRGNNNYGRNDRPPKKKYDPLVDKATAPYNFIPLTPVVLPSPLVLESGATYEEQYTSYINKEGTYSGVIGLDIVTKTPFYIGGGTGSDFFAPPGRGPIIPGSAMRGMVKNIMKILTCGAMRPAGRKNIDVKEVEGDGDFHDRKLYFRTFAAKKGIGIKEEYDAELMKKGVNGLLESKAEPGFLLRIGKSYYIRKTEKEIIHNEAIVDQYSIPNKPSASSDQNCIQWDWTEETLNGERVVACFTGRMNSKKHYTVHKIPSDWKQENLLEVSNSCIIDYQDDSARRGIDLFKVGKSKKEAVKFTGRDDVSYV
ncbi:MAG: hypothetical protein IKW79_06510, partial [Schwartzia sp.]|nr:hypothetical protein [Schwartzia sp. (in: firmicutes)]